jgi:two-component sensor histidine kinase
MDQRMKRSKKSEDYQLLYEHLVAILLEDLRTEYKAALKIVSNHLATFSGIIKMQFRKGSREYKEVVKAYREGIRALKDVEKAVSVLDDLLKTLYKKKA